MPDSPIPAADLPVVTPGASDFVVGVQLGDARLFPLANLPLPVEDEARIATLEAGQTAGMLGFQTKALMDADLAHPAGTLALVTNDATPANNGTYRKTGASGAGSWVLSADRVTALEGDVATLEAIDADARLDALEAADPIARATLQKSAALKYSDRAKAAVVVLCGQSLASVRTSQPILKAKAAPEKTFMPVGGPNFSQYGVALNNAAPWTPYASAVALEEAVGQSPLVAVASTVIGGKFDRAYLASVAQPGQQILYNACSGGRANLYAAVHQLCDFARAAGYDPVVMYYLCTGEEDASLGTPQATFVARMKVFAKMAQLVAAQAMNRPDYTAPIFATYPNQMWFGDNERAIKEGMRQAAALPGLINVGPSYVYPVDNDRVHNTNTGMIYRGEFVGKAMRDWYEKGDKAVALTITDVTLSGATFIATFSAPVVRDATLNFGGNLAPGVAKDGFEWIDNGTPIAISNLVYAGWTVTGTLATAPVGTMAQQVLRIAMQNAVGTALPDPANVAGSVVRVTGAGWPSIYNPSYTQYQFASPQKCIPRAP